MTPTLDFGIGPPQALLLQAALNQDREAGAAALAEWWRGIASFDEVQGTDSALLVQIHANLGSRIADQRLLNRMKGAARHVWLRNQYMVADCAKLVGALAEAGVPTVLLKGAAMVVAIDRHVGLRWMSDCDVLVPPEEALTAIRVLAERGFTKDQELTPRDLGLVHGITLHDKGSGRDRIDLHWQPIRDIGADSMTRAIFEGAKPAAIGGVASLVPAPEHMIFHAIVHGTEWSPLPRYDWLVDTVKVVRRAGGDFDWDTVCRTARTYRFGFLVAAALGEASRHFPGLVPAGAVASLVPRGAYFERREALIRKAAPASRTVADELLVAGAKARRASDAALRRPLVRTAPAIYRSLYGPATATRAAMAGGDLAVTFLHGWSAPEEKGRWTDGHLASIALAHGEARRPDALRLRLHTLPAPSLGPQTVSLSSGFRHLGDLHWAADGGGPFAHMLAVPAGAWRRGTMVMRMAIARPTAPAAIGLGGDPRALGVFLEEVSAIPATADLLSQHLRVSDAKALPLLWNGWAPPEPSGAWTLGKHAVMRWRTPAPIPAGHRLLVALVGRTPGDNTLTGQFCIGGRIAARFAYPPSAGLATTVALPLARAYRAGETITFAIAIDNPSAPSRLTGHGDPRPLGLLVEALRIAPG